MTAGPAAARPSPLALNPLRRERRVAHPCPVLWLAVILDTTLAGAAMTAAPDLLAAQGLLAAPLNGARI
jgi:hypothetical protein